MRYWSGRTAQASSAALMTALVLSLSLPFPCSARVPGQDGNTRALKAGGNLPDSTAASLTIPGQDDNSRGQVLAQLDQPPPGPGGRPPGPPPRWPGDSGQPRPGQMRPGPPDPARRAGPGGPARPSPGLPPPLPRRNNRPAGDAPEAAPGAIQDGRNPSTRTGSPPLRPEAERRFLDDSLLQETGQQRDVPAPDATGQGRGAGLESPPARQGGAGTPSEERSNGLQALPGTWLGVPGWTLLGGFAILLLLLGIRIHRRRNTGSKAPNFFHADGLAEHGRAARPTETGQGSAEHSEERIHETLTRRQRERTRDNISRENARQAEERDARMAEERYARQEKRHRKEERKREEERARARKHRGRNSTGETAGREEYDRAWACRVLGISPQASAEEIKKAYLAGMKNFHPDQAANMGEAVQANFSELAKRLNVAYDMLRDTKK